MSIRLMSDVWENSPHEGGTLLVHLSLADYANDVGECWPAISTLALKSRLSDRQVQRCIGDLVSTGQLEYVRKSTRKGESNRYRLIFADKMSPKRSGDICGKDGVTPMSYKPSEEEPSLSVNAETIERTIYLAYPRHTAPRHAERAIKAAIKRGNSAAMLSEKTKAFAAATVANKTERRFIPHPATWFNGDRFLEDPATWLNVTAKAPANYANNGGFGETRQLGI